MTYRARLERSPRMTRKGQHGRLQLALRRLYLDADPSPVAPFHDQASSAKALSLLKEAVPALRRVAVLWNAANPAFTSVWQSVKAVAGSLDLTLVSEPVREPEDFPAAFAAIASLRPEAFFVLTDALLGLHLSEIIEFAANERLPSGSTFREFAAAGGLMSYGPNLAALLRQAADYVDRVFKGESPATLPFQQPTTFELVINLKTAEALGLTLPQLLLTRADD